MSPIGILLDAHALALHTNQAADNEDTRYVEL